MSSFNQVILMGNLVRDPELRVTPRGSAICQGGIAVNRDYKDEAGNKKSEVTFVDFEAWGKTAELIAKYLTKGRGAMLVGRLKLDSWEDKQTQQKRSKLKVVVEQVQFIGGRGEQTSAPVESQSELPSGGGVDFSKKLTRDRPTPPPQENIDEDVPF